jgi:hypothetical protein
MAHMPGFFTELRGLRVLRLWDIFPIEWATRRGRKQTASTPPVKERLKMMTSNPGSEVTLGHSAPRLSRRISRFALEQRSRIDDAKLDDGVRRLMWAILKDTLRNYQSNIDSKSVHRQRLFREANHWIHSRDLGWVFSFESICAVLGIDSDYLRTEITRWRKRHRGCVNAEEVGNAPS